MTNVTPFTEIFNGLLGSFGELHLIVAVLFLVLFGVFIFVGIEPKISLAMTGLPLLLLAASAVYVTNIGIAVFLMVLAVIFAGAFAALFLR